MNEQLTTEPPRVSVLIATHNHERYIAQALDSVLAQKGLVDYEILVGEDCSTDRTREIVVAYRDRFPERIRLELPERNLGGGGSRIFFKLLRHAEGRYVALLDGDDYWTSPSKLARQVSYLDGHPDCTVCFHNASEIYEGIDRQPSLYCGPTQRPFSTLFDLLAGNCLPTGSVMYRRIPDLDTTTVETALFADSVLHLLHAQHGVIGYLPEVMSVYRVHRSGAYSSQVYDFEAGGAAFAVDPWFETHLGFLRLAEMQLGAAYLPAIARERAATHFEFSCALAAAGSRPLARRHLLQSWRAGWWRGGVRPRRIATGLLGQFAPGPHRALRRVVRGQAPPVRG